MERSASLLSRGRLEAARTMVGQSRARMRVDEMERESERVLTTSKCMAPKEGSLHDCRSQCDRRAGETRWCNGAGLEEGERVDQK